MSTEVYYWSTGEWCYGDELHLMDHLPADDAGMFEIEDETWEEIDEIVRVRNESATAR